MVSLSLSLSLSLYVSLFLHKQVGICMYLQVFLCTCIYMYAYKHNVYTHMYIYTYIYVHTYMYICTHMQIRTYVFRYMTEPRVPLIRGFHGDYLRILNVQAVSEGSTVPSYLLVKYTRSSSFPPSKPAGYIHCCGPSNAGPLAGAGAQISFGRRAKAPAGPGKQKGARLQMEGPGLLYLAVPETLFKC